TTTNAMDARIDLSTDDVPEAERFDFWREACCEPLGLTPERVDNAAPFNAQVSRLAVGSLLYANYKQVSACHVRRDLREISRHPRQSCSIYRECGPGAWFRRAGQEFTTAYGDFVVSDLDLPFETRPLAGGYAHEVWLIPKIALAPYLPASGRPMLQKLTANSGVEKLLAAYLDALGREAANMAHGTIDRVTDTLCRLIGIAFGLASGEQADAVRDARLVQAKQYIEQHVADPHLSPARVASALGVSLRSLHVAFEPAGTTVTNYIRRRRLDECRAALLNDPSRPVTDIAFAWGFGSLSGFYRAFRAAFDATPGDLRAVVEKSSQY
ncbi:MAG TPA: helix-turn-helix domain-containing protein, partial [Acetobacteraceae bacterium]